VLKKKEHVLLALGTNLGDRLKNMREAVKMLSLAPMSMSHVIETEALIPENAPPEWDLPYLNMILATTTDLPPTVLLGVIKDVEKRMGRDTNSRRWSPRIIDVDILMYGEQTLDSEALTIPHKALKERDFWQFLLECMGCKVPGEVGLSVANYRPLNHFVLQPQLVGIVNVTPDSFSDGGRFSDPVAAEIQARRLYQDGASVVDIGAQSTRPGYVEISPAEEISRLAEVLERCRDLPCISVDTYFDEVVEYALQKSNVKWINDQNSNLSNLTLRLLADRGVKLVVMQHGAAQDWFEHRLKYLENLGMMRSNLILDPGIGFGKSKYQNLLAINNLKMLKRHGCEVLLGVSRKSFISSHSNASPWDRDPESISAASCAAGIVDYLRVHNVRDHMKFFVTKHCIENARPD
jgi:2-amino-4-hydroxy-6-hydroxymethyldihydropteridine diphosphokinase/dihydropteroate synthase